MGKLYEIVRLVEEQMNYQYTSSELESIVDYATRKCERNGKGDGYLDLLLVDELLDHVRRQRINRIGEINYGRN